MEQLLTSAILGFGLGGHEMLFIFLAVLLLFGAKKLPQLARGIGKSMGEFKKAREEFEHEIQRSEDFAKSELMGSKTNPATSRAKSASSEEKVG